MMGVTTSLQLNIDSHGRFTTMQRLGLIVATVTAILLGAASTTEAQTITTGALAGKVTDATGAVLPGVTVTLSGPAMQGTQTATTDSLGTFRFRNVPPGQGYKITAKLTSFRDASIDNLQVFLGQEGSVAVSMAPAGVTEAVTVAGGSPRVDVPPTQ